MSYVSGSEGPSVSGYDVQGPKPLPASAFGQVHQASASVIIETPSSVIIQGSGSFHFLFSSTSAVGSAVVAGGISTTPNFTNLAESASMELPIHPCAWSGSAGTGNAGANSGQQQVIFVYKGGL